MPDWVRIGPQYGQINELINPFVNGGAFASADVQRFGAAGWWGGDKWSPVASGPGSAIASWSITASAGAQTYDASSFYNPVQPISGQIESRQWQIYNATTTPPSLIVAFATVALPYLATGMMVFEMVGGATFAAFPVVPELVTAPALQGGAVCLVASANGSVIGSAVPAAGSAAIFEMSRAYLHAPVPSNWTGSNEEDLFPSFRFAYLQFRTVGTVASGAMLRIQMMRLAVLPVPWIGTNAGPLATAALAQASSLVGTWYSQIQNGIHVGAWGVSRLARYPAIATIDAQQPNGQALEIGSTIIAGQAQWGSDLVQKNYAQSLLTPGDPLAFERIPNRQIVFPYISRNASGNSHLFQRELERAIKPGNVIDVIPEDFQIAAAANTPTGMYRRFDIVDGRVVNNEDLRYQRAGLARGELQVQTMPYPRAASYMVTSIVSSAGLPGAIYMPGDVPAPVYYSAQGVGVAVNGSGGNTTMTGFVAMIVPSMATFNPIGMNPTAQGNSIASMPNGYRVAGSQNNFQISLSAQTNIAAGFYAPGMAEALGGRVRVFAVIANASTATIPLQLNIFSGNTFVATTVSNIGYLKPLITAASEMPQLSLVDLGEVRLPMEAAAMNATITWNLKAATAASSNATGGVFDSVLFCPVGDPKGWFGAVPLTSFAAIYTVTASNTLVTFSVAPWAGQPGTGQVALPYQLRNGAMDVTSQYQGRSPYLSPGMSWVWTVPIGGASRAFTQGSSNQPNTAAAVKVYAYPRFLFLQ